MNEEELKKIWQSDQSVPQIDFASLKKSLSDWHKHLRRKIKIDIVAQLISVAAVVIIVWIFPKLYLLFPLTIVLATWYIWEILSFYRLENWSDGDRNVKQALDEKLRSLKNFIRRARVVFYTVPLVIVLNVYYALVYEDISTIVHNLQALIITLIIGEITAIAATEIYFKFFYSSAIGGMKDLLQQLEIND